MDRTVFYGDRIPRTVFKNITLDGVAVWNDPADAAGRTNSGVSVSGNGYLIQISSGSSVVLEEGAVLQNNHLKNSEFNGAAVSLTGTGSNLTMKSGSVIRNNAAEGTGSRGVGAGTVFNMEGGTISGNYASVQGGAVKAEGTFRMTGGEISGNAAGNNSGAVGNAAGSSVELSGNAKITGNKAAAGGGSVPFEFISVGGNVQITGNTTLTGKENNVHIYFPEYYLSVESALGSDSHIGITSKTAPTEQAPVSVAKGDGYTIAEKDIAQFSEDTKAGFLFCIDGSEIKLTLDKADPVFKGIEDGKIYCVSAEFTVEESNLDTVIADNVPLSLTNGKYILNVGTHTVTATDTLGNSTTVTVTVNASHTPEADDNNCKTAVMCSVCNKTAIEGKEHDFTGEWKKDGKSHWHECGNSGCSVTETKADHIFEWITDKAATETEKGSKHEECTICGYAKAAVDIPATGSTTDPENPSESETSKGETDLPKTGDYGNMVLLLIAIHVVSGMGLTSTLIYRKTKKR